MRGEDRRSAIETTHGEIEEYCARKRTFLAIGYCTTERTSDCICSLAVSPKGVALSFYYGASLSDPDGILQGEGKQNRFVRLGAASKLSNPSVERLIAAAIANAKTPLPTGKRGYLVIKSLSAKQRPRR